MVTLAPEFRLRRAILEAAPEIVARVGADGLHPARVPQGAGLPAGRFAVVSTTRRVQRADGNGQRVTVVQVDWFAFTAREAAELRDLMISAVADRGFPALALQGVFHVAGRTWTEPALDASGPPVFGAGCDLEVWSADE